MLVVRKDEVDDDEEERERLIREKCLYKNGDQTKVGASGALARTGVLDALSVMSEARSTSSSTNVRQAYHIKSLDLANEKGRTAALKADLPKAGLNPATVLNELGVSPQGMNQDDTGSPDDNDDVAEESTSPGTAIPGSETERSPKLGVQFQELPGRKMKHSDDSPSTKSECRGSSGDTQQ